MCGAGGEGQEGRAVAVAVHTSLNLKIEAALETVATPYNHMPHWNDAMMRSDCHASAPRSIGLSQSRVCAPHSLLRALHHGMPCHQTRSRGGSKSRWLGPGALRCLFCSLSSLCRKERTYSPTVQLAPVGVVNSGQ